MLARPLPISPDRNQENTNNKRRDYLGRLPLRRDATRNRKWHEDQSHHGNHKNQSDDIKMPEKFQRETAASEKLHGALVRLQLPGAFCATVNEEQNCDQWQRTHGVNNGEHADAPAPRGHFQHGGCEVSADPGVDLSCTVRPNRDLLSEGNSR